MLARRIEERRDWVVIIIGSTVRGSRGWGDESPLHRRTRSVSRHPHQRRRGVRPSVQRAEQWSADVDHPDTVSGTLYSSPASNPFVGRPGRDEMFAYGFRNPWRFSFDRLTGQQWVGDVGQGSSLRRPRRGRYADHGWRQLRLARVRGRSAHRRGSRALRQSGRLHLSGLPIRPLVERAVLHYRRVRVSRHYGRGGWTYTISPAKAAFGPSGGTGSGTRRNGSATIAGQAFSVEQSRW